MKIFALKKTKATEVFLFSSFISLFAMDSCCVAFFVCVGWFCRSSFLIVVCVVFNLTNGVDAEKTRQRVEEYRRMNQSLIQKNKARAVSDTAHAQPLITAQCWSSVRDQCVVECCKMYVHMFSVCIHLSTVYCVPSMRVNILIYCTVSIYNIL